MTIAFHPSDLEFDEEKLIRKEKEKEKEKELERPEESLKNEFEDNNRLLTLLPEETEKKPAQIQEKKQGKKGRRSKEKKSISRTKRIKHGLGTCGIYFLAVLWALAHPDLSTNYESHGGGCGG